MASNASGDEGVDSFTPKPSSSSRPKNRRIIRWTDEKLVMAFAQLRQSCTNYRIDIRRPLEDAAKAIGPHCTADALVQQLSKRRNRMLKDGWGTPTNTPQAKQSLPIAAAVDSSGAALSAATTPAKPVGRPRTSSRVKKDSLKKEDSLPKTPSLASETDSEYMESPLKGKNKRARQTVKKVKKGKAPAKKVKEESDIDPEQTEEERPTGISNYFPSKSSGEINENKTVIKGLLKAAAAIVKTPSLRKQRAKKDKSTTAKSSGAHSGAGHVEDVYIERSDSEPVVNAYGKSGLTFPMENSKLAVREFPSAPLASHPVFPGPTNVEKMTEKRAREAARLAYLSAGGGLGVAAPFIGSDFGQSANPGNAPSQGSPPNSEPFSANSGLGIGNPLSGTFAGHMTNTGNSFHGDMTTASSAFHGNMYQSPNQTSGLFNAPMGSLVADFESDENMINEAFPAAPFHEGYAHSSLPDNAVPLSVPPSSELSQLSFGSFESQDQPPFAGPNANFQNNLNGMSFTSSATEDDGHSNIDSLTSQPVQCVPQHREASEEWNEYLHLE